MLLRTILVIAFCALPWPVLAASAQALAQECANQMARAGRFDHMGFGARNGGTCDGRGRCARGSRAEVIAIASSREGAIARWQASRAGHREIYAMGVSIASAGSGKRMYWCGVVGE